MKSDEARAYTLDLIATLTLTVVLNECFPVCVPQDRHGQVRRLRCAASSARSHRQRPCTPVTVNTSCLARRRLVRRPMPNKLSQLSAHHQATEASISAAFAGSAVSATRISLSNTVTSSQADPGKPSNLQRQHQNPLTGQQREPSHPHIP